MKKKWWGIFATAALSIVFATNALGAYDLEKQSGSQNVKEVVSVIRGMYEKTNSGNYSVKGNQWLKIDKYGRCVVKAVVSNGDVALDQVMKSNGYKKYSIEYYYDNPDYGKQYVSGYDGPNFAFAVIDGKEYRYYFAQNSMIRRIGPDGVVNNNPKTNDFINQIYQTGRLYQNDLSVCLKRSLKQDTICFADTYYNCGDHLALYATINDSGIYGRYGLYIVDADTKIESVIQEETTWRKGDNGYTWLNRHLQTNSNEGGYSASLECFQVNTTGNHVDVIQGIYATH